MVEFIKKYKGYIISFIGGFLVCLLIWLCSSNHELKKEIIEVENPKITTKTEVETIIKTDTVTIYKEVVKPEYITETIIRTDTIKEETVVPIVQRGYIEMIDNDSIKGKIETVVSGYNPQLDSIKYKFEFYPKTITNTVETTVTKEVTKYKQKKINFGVFVGPTYNFISKKFDLSVGCGIVFAPF